MSQVPLKTDVVVIGSGAAGMAAAVTLAEGGARVTVLEKRRTLGGTSNFFGGMFAVESEMQRARYITYSRDQVFKNIMEYSHWKANPRLVRAIVDESAVTISWLKKQGVEFRDVLVNIPETPPTYHFVKGRGRAMMKILLKRAKSLGVFIMPGAAVKQIVRKGNQIIGVEAETSGNDIRIQTPAVIIASGGYANHKEWIKRYTGFDLDVNLIPFCNFEKTGDGIRMAFEAGAAEEGIETLEILRTGYVGRLLTPSLGYVVVQPDLWVNRQGERFCDESISYSDTSVGNASARQKDGTTFSIFDTAIKQYLIEVGIDKTMKMDFPPGSPIPNLDQELESTMNNKSTEVFKAETIIGLAEMAGIEPENLQLTVNEYNGFCDKGHDDVFAKSLKFLRPIRKPPFYAIKAHTVFLGTMGGIKINERTEVIDTKGQVIPGLYAAGLDAGGMYGDGYPIQVCSGMASSFATSSGRIAGRNALKFIGK